METCGSWCSHYSLYCVRPTPPFFYSRSRSRTVALGLPVGESLLDSKPQSVSRAHTSPLSLSIFVEDSVSRSRTLDESPTVCIDNGIIIIECASQSHTVLITVNATPRFEWLLDYTTSTCCGSPSVRYYCVILQE